ncbi:MAG: glycine cleavage system protein GcvH [Phycisphaeraceae bacterium]|nr:glycine cleavage system protein GcvH [Phycisphaerales bacterium]MCB9861347.1 glycine cleavage system protein GcvH [Phycisphaeraceae bacterium]
MAASDTPTDRVYSETHEWHKLDGDVVTIGLTRFAVDNLTDVTYAEMRPAGTSVAASDVIGEVESVKTTSDVYSAVSGEIIEINSTLADDPGCINSDPYGAGWLVKVKATNAGELDALKSAADYDASL